MSGVLTRAAGIYAGDRLAKQAGDEVSGAHVIQMHAGRFIATRLTLLGQDHQKCGRTVGGVSGDPARDGLYQLPGVRLRGSRKIWSRVPGFHNLTRYITATLSETFSTTAMSCEMKR